MEEIKMTQDQPSQLVDEALSELIWPDHALGRPLAGTLDTVGAMTRQDIIGYKNRFYTPGLVTIAAAGDIDQKKLLKSAKELFSGMRGTDQKRADYFQRKQEKPRVRLVAKTTEQTHLSLGLHTFAKNHADEYALDILSILLGGNMSSRLFNEVREERGLAYDIGSSVRKYHETGAFGIEAGVDTKKIIEALAVILKELKKTTKEHFKADEIKRAKEFYLGQLDLGLENSMNHMLWMGESVVCLGRTRTPAEVIERVEKITADDLKRVASQVFQSRNLNLAVVGPRVDTLENDFKRELNFGA
jgi:predicted Zn-dependent peptidase